MAAFMGVWPVFKFPHLLDEYLLPHWSKLRYLYVLFIGFSAALSYLGFLAMKEAAPLVVRIGGTGAGQRFLDDVAANTIYDLVKAAVLGVLVLGGVYVTRERKRIGNDIEDKKLKEWELQIAEYSRSQADATIEGGTRSPSDGPDLG